MDECIRADGPHVDHVKVVGTECWSPEDEPDPDYGDPASCSDPGCESCRFGDD